MTIRLLSFCLLITPLYVCAEDLFSIDPERVKQAGRTAVMERHPNVAFIEDAQDIVMIMCTPLSDGVSLEVKLHQCSAHLDFKVADTVKEEIIKEGDTCMSSFSAAKLSVTVYSDGTTQIGNGFGGQSREIPCPEDILSQE